MSAGPAPPQYGGKEMLTMITDWRIDRTAGKQFGICMVDVPPPLEYLSFKRGFPLTNPGHARCAAFSLRLGLEICLDTHEVPAAADAATGTSAAAAASAGEVKVKMVRERVLKDRFAVIVTRSQVIYDIFCGCRADKTRKWAQEPSMQPRTMFDYNKTFFCKVFEMIDEMRGGKFGEIAFVPPTDEDEGNVLLRHEVDLDVDPERDYGKTDSHVGAEQRMDDMKQRQYLRNELSEATGARSSRARRRPTKSERRVSLGAPKKDEPAHEKTPDNGTGGTPAPAAAGPDSSTSPGTRARACASKRSRCQRRRLGTKRAEAGDAGGHVQDPEHGAGGGEQPAEDRAGNHEAEPAAAAKRQQRPEGDGQDPQGDDGHVHGSPQQQ